MMTLPAIADNAVLIALGVLIVDAIIGTQYGKDAEIALLNKAIADPTNPDYEIYNAFRALAKQSAKDAMAWWENK